MRMCAKLTLAICFAFVTGVIGVAQEKKVKMSELPAAVQATVKAESKGAKIRGLDTEVEKGQRLYEAEMIVNGHGKDISIDESGKVVEVEEEVPLDQVPAAAKSAIEKGAKGGKIGKIESVTTGGKLVAYEAQVRKGAKHSEVRVDPEGNPAPED